MTGPRVWRATELDAAKPKAWLARNRLPQSGVTVLVGEEGIGKSLFWVWIVSAVTTGKPLPEFGIPARDPQHVRLVLTEDDWSTEVLPRLLLSGADLDYISVVAVESDGSGSPVFPSEDMELMYEAPVPALIVVDAWLDTVPANLNVQTPQDARIALHPWKDVAVQTQASILLMTHTNRAKGSSARDKYGITSELRKKARMTLFAQRDAQGQLVIGPEKANGTAIVPASVFAIEVIALRPPTDDDDGTVPKLRYVGESKQNVEQLLADSAEGVGTEQKWLIEFLADGSKTRTQVFEAGHTQGFSRYQIYKASRLLKVCTEKKGFQGETLWVLP